MQRRCSLLLKGQMVVHLSEARGKQRVEGSNLLVSLEEAISAGLVKGKCKGFHNNTGSYTQ